MPSTMPCAALVGKNAGAVPTPAGAWRWRRLRNALSDDRWRWPGRRLQVDSKVLMFGTACLEPRPHAYNESDLTRVAAFLPDERRGFPEASLQRDTNVGRKFTPNLIAQAHAEFEVIQA